MRMRLRKAESAGRWCLGSAVNRLRILCRRSQDIPRVCGKQLAADDVEVSQREHDEGAGEVLGQAAIADRGEAPQPLHHVEGMFPAGARARSSTVDLAPALAQ